MKKDIEAFIVRVWQEAENIKGKQAVWRGSIVHVGSNRQLYFYSLDSIARFIQEHTQEPDSEYPGSQAGIPNNFKSAFINQVYEHFQTLRTKILRGRQQ